METKIIRETIRASDLLRGRIKNMVPRNDRIIKSMAVKWGLKIDVAHPYFQDERYTFLKFMDMSVKFLGFTYG